MTTTSTSTENRDPAPGQHGAVDHGIAGDGWRMTRPPIMTKTSIAEVLKRANYSPTVIEEMLALFEDLVDEAQFEAAFRRYGVTRDLLISRFGGSP